MEVVTTRVPSKGRLMIEAAAEREGLTLSAFARKALQERATRVLLELEGPEREGEDDGRDG